MSFSLWITVTVSARSLMRWTRTMKLSFFWLATWVKGHSKGFYDWKLLNESFLLYNSNYYPILHNVIIPWCAESASQTTTYTKQNAPIVLPKTFAKSSSFDNSLEQVLNTKKDAWNSMNKSYRNDKYSWPWNALKRCLSFRSLREPVVQFHSPDLIINSPHSLPHIFYSFNL